MNNSIPAEKPYAGFRVNFMSIVNLACVVLFTLVSYKMYQKGQQHAGMIKDKHERLEKVLADNTHFHAEYQQLIFAIRDDLEQFISLSQLGLSPQAAVNGNNTLLNTAWDLNDELPDYINDAAAQGVSEEFVRLLTFPGRPRQLLRLEIPYETNIVQELDASADDSNRDEIDRVLGVWKAEGDAFQRLFPQFLNRLDVVDHTEQSPSLIEKVRTPDDQAESSASAFRIEQTVQFRSESRDFPQSAMIDIRMELDPETRELTVFVMLMDNLL
ncbi:MAG: hypothetical protein CMJ46_13560 [Planctomyces sp.]|nr:hypothetical protein [Planctomyces sp.]